MTLIPELREIIEQRMTHENYRCQALLHWGTLPEDWQQFLARHFATYTAAYGGLRARACVVILLFRHAQTELADLDLSHMISFLNLTSIVGLDDKERLRYSQGRDKDIGHLVPFFIELLQSRGITNAEQVVTQTLVAARFPALPPKKKRAERKILTEAMRVRAIAVLPTIPYEGYVRPMHELYMRGLLRAGKRGANYDGLRWPKRGDDHGILRATGGTFEKLRTDHVPDDYDEALLKEIRVPENPFATPGRLVIHDYQIAQQGRCVSPRNGVKRALYTNVRFLAGIPEEYSFDARAIRHRILTTAWANGASTDELRAIANHLAGSTVVERFYLVPLEVFEASKFTDRILGVSTEHVCEVCMLNLMPYHRKCPRKSCGEPVPQRSGGRQEASLDAYVDLIGNLEATA
jgi:hypothetical protein